MPGLKDRYVIQLTVQELENLIHKIEYEGGVAFKNDIFNRDYNLLDNKPDLSIYAEKTEIPTNFITLGQLDTRSDEIKNSLIGTFNDGLDGEIWTIKKVGTGFYIDKTNINFTSNGALFSSIEYRRGIEEEGMPIPDDEIVYGDTVVGLVSPTTDLFNTEVRWIDPNYATIKFINKKPSGKLLEWLQLFGVKDTIRGVQDYADSQDQKILQAAKQEITNRITSDKLPKATTKQFGVVKVGQGLKISSTGALIATGEGVTASAVEWNNVINKPQADEIENDQYYLTLINTLGTVARSNNYNDLNNKPDLSIYAEKSAIQNLYKLPVATTETLGGVKIDGKTITIKDGIIKAQDAGAKIKWRKWTE